MKHVTLNYFTRHSVILSVLAILLVIALVPTGIAIGNYVHATVNEFVLGDVDIDGSVTAADARLALRAAVGLENYKSGSDKFKRADYDGSGVIEASDARSILRVAVGLNPNNSNEDPHNNEEPTPEKGTITLSDGRVIPDNEIDLWDTFTYNGKTYKELCHELLILDYEGFNAKYKGYSCGCKNHKCTNPLDHVETVEEEIRGCSICHSHECPSLYSEKNTDCPEYTIYKDATVYCQTCGKLIGYGPDKCIVYIQSCYCPVCGVYSTGMSCHHCKGNPYGTYTECYDMWTGGRFN